jgi:hypothetical protein
MMKQLNFAYELFLPFPLSPAHAFSLLVLLDGLGHL